MGSDIHGPWIERVGVKANGEEYAHDIAELHIFDRDYVLFDILNGARHGPSGWTLGPSKGIPDAVGYAWKDHLQRSYRLEWEHMHRIREEMLANRPKGKHKKQWEEFVKNGWGMGRFDHEAYRNGSCYGHSWIGLDEAKEAARRYVEYFVSWAADDPVSFAGRDWDRCQPLDLAIEIMEWAEANLLQPGESVRMCFCYDC